MAALLIITVFTFVFSVYFFTQLTTVNLFSCLKNTARSIIYYMFAVCFYFYFFTVKSLTKFSIYYMLRMQYVFPFKILIGSCKYSQFISAFIFFSFYFENIFSKICWKHIFVNFDNSVNPFLFSKVIGQIKEKGWVKKFRQKCKNVCFKNDFECNVIENH